MGKIMKAEPKSCGAGKHDWQVMNKGMPVRTRCKKCGLSGPRDSQDRHWTAGLP